MARPVADAVAACPLPSLGQRGLRSSARYPRRAPHVRALEVWALAARLLLAELATERLISAGRVARRSLALRALSHRSFAIQRRDALRRVSAGTGCDTPIYFLIEQDVGWRVCEADRFCIVRAFSVLDRSWSFDLFFRHKEIMSGRNLVWRTRSGSSVLRSELA